MNPETVSAFSDYLAGLDAEWRAAAGYTGRPVHRRAYWQNMAARILADAPKAIARESKKPTEKQITE
jgi:hypothetical protein